MNASYFTTVRCGPRNVHFQIRKLQCGYPETIFVHSSGIEAKTFVNLLVRKKVLADLKLVELLICKKHELR